VGKKKKKNLIRSQYFSTLQWWGFPLKKLTVDSKNVLKKISIHDLIEDNLILVNQSDISLS